MRKRFLSLVLLICLISTLLPLPAFGEEVLLSADFEEESSLWLGGSITPEAAHDGENGMLLSSPIGGETNAGFANILEYNSSVSLEEGKIYRLSFWVKTSDPVLGSRSNSVSVNGGTLNFEIQTVPNEWSQVTVNFIAPESRDFSLDLLFYTAVEAPFLAIDSLTLSVTQAIPASFSLVGRKTLTIPPVGENTYRYRLDALDELGNRISSPLSEFEIPSLPTGVSFDAQTATVAVSDQAEDGTSFTLISKIPGQEPLYHTITLTENLLVNGDFEDTPLWFGWDKEFSRLYEEGDSENRILCLEPSNGTDSDSFASLRQENPVTLIGGELYVLRARVRSTDDVPEDFLYTQNTSQSSDTSITIDISGISGSDWQEIHCAIRPEVTGNYEIILNFHNSFFQPIFVDNIELKKEVLAPAEIQFSAPGHIARPRDDMEIFPISYTTLDQEGNWIDGGALIPSVMPDDGSVIVDPDSCLLLVFPSASVGEYTLSLSTQDGALTASIPLVISEEKIGDGSFEEKIPGQWWAAQSPSRLTMPSVSGGQEPTDGTRMARLDLSGEVTAMLSNGYSTYHTDETYVFHINAQKGYTDVETVLTAVIADQFGEYTFLASESLVPGEWNEISAVFSPTEDLTGRLILFFSVLDEQLEQWVLLDDVSIEKVWVGAENAELFGNGTAGETLSASYDFISNFETDDASLLRWYLSPEKNGPYTLLEGKESSDIYLAPNYAGYYLRLEVVPVSLIGGFSGESVWSEPIYIFASELPPEELPTEEPLPQVTAEPTEIPFAPMPLPEGAEGISFTDTDTHWAKEEIGQLAAVSVITGYEDGSFRPDESITRAEFTALLVRAFALEEIPYSGRFTDVSSSDWYADIIETAYGHSLVSGTSESEFSPTAPITREQMAVMIMRAYHKAEGAPITIIPGIFFDELEISDWARGAVEEASSLGIVRGTTPSIFAPKGVASRAQAAVMLVRLIEKLN